ncbi:MAG: hypothetical protein J0M24_06020 [Verrucomicrobia bacterium]|nr:hypothetical protein [Verrucomicrobiota bacterium]
MKLSRPSALNAFASFPRHLLVLLLLMLPLNGLRAASFQLVADFPVIETDENRPRVALQVRLDPGLNPDPVTVRFTVVGGTARDGVDFKLSEPTVVLEPFIPFGLVFLEILSDGEVEPTRNILLQASIEGASTGSTQLEVLIRDGDSPGLVGFISPRFSVNEAVPGGLTEISLWRTQDVKKPAEVAVRIEGQGLDALVEGQGPVVMAKFAPGDSRAYLRLPLVNDSLALGDRELRLAIEAEGTTLERIPELTTAVLTISDDDVDRGLEPLTVRDWVNDGIRGVQITGRVPRGFQQRIEYSDAGVEGPWQILTVLLGQEGESTAFDSYEASFGMRMYRSVPVDPLELTLPW